MWKKVIFLRLKASEKLRKRASTFSSLARVARWHIFKPKSLIWVFTRGTCNGRCWYIIWLLEYFTDIRYILRLLGIFYSYVVFFPRFGMLYQEKSGNPVSRDEKILTDALFDE
jgi:hypothetical protein